MGGLVIIGGYIAAMCASTLWWQRGRFIEFLPILYGAVVGLILPQIDKRFDVLEGLLSFAFVGVGFWFAVWIEIIRPERKSNSGPRSN